jgi:hypothetical protein
MYAVIQMGFELLMKTQMTPNLEKLSKYWKKCATKNIKCGEGKQIKCAGYPLWKNNENLDQEYSRYCLVFFFVYLGIFWYILVGYAGIFLVYFGISWYIIPC